MTVLHIKELRDDNSELDKLSPGVSYMGAPGERRARQLDVRDAANQT